MAEEKDNKAISTTTNQKYHLPEYKKSAFHCPHCEVYADQHWSEISRYNTLFFSKNIKMFLEKEFNPSYPHNSLSNLLNFLNEIFNSLYIKNSFFSLCAHCKKYSIWVNEPIKANPYPQDNWKMFYPNVSTAPLPIEEMPDSVKELYNEAREIVGKSPRGACALLRLAIETLLKEIGLKGKTLKAMIEGSDLSERIKNALKTVRVVGNNAVHPGEIDIKDKPEIANKLFTLINFICDKMIKEPKIIDGICDDLFTKEDTKEAIKQRDKQ